MAKDSEIKKTSDSSEVVYMKDDFYGIAIRFYKDGETMKLYMKHEHGGTGKEREVPYGNEDAFNVRLGGDIITKEEYDRYPAK